jgi:putative hemolysin
MAQSQASPAPAGNPIAPAVDPGRILFYIGVVVALIFFNAFFAMAEIALITVRRTRIKQLVEEDNRAAILVERLLAHPTRMLATIQTSVTLIGTFSAAIAAATMVDPLANWLSVTLVGAGHHAAATLALLIVELPVAVLTLVIGEIAPKSLAVRNSERLALVTVYPIRWLQYVLSPVVSLLTFLSNIIVRPFGGTATFRALTVNEEELKMIVEAGEEQGVLNPEETEMIHSILGFGDTVVRKVMTPRIDITALDVRASVDEIKRAVTQSGHSRIPVYEGDLDHIVGVVHAKDLLTGLAEGTVPDGVLRKVMRPPYFVPETKRIDVLLADLRRRKQQLAIVVDEYGVTAGVATIEDMLEEIVGDIQDEYDEEEPEVQVIDHQTSILSGKMGLEDVNDRMGLDLPVDEADTIGGFVFGLLGRQPSPGDRVRWEHTDFSVEAIDGRRITKVRAIQHPAPPDGQAVPPPAPQVVNGTGPERDGSVSTSGVETAPDLPARP